MAGDNEIKSSNYGESDNRGSSGETKDDRSRPGPGGGDGGHLDQFVAGTGEHYLVKRSDNTWRKYEPTLFTETCIVVRIYRNTIKQIVACFELLILSPKA